MQQTQTRLSLSGTSHVTTAMCVKMTMWFRRLQMLYTKNPAGYEFRWPGGSDYIEVFHNQAIYPNEPLEVVQVLDLKYSESDLKRFANETPDYGRPYAEQA
jgi:hypothetical protein